MTNADTDRLLRRTCAGDESALFALYSEFKDAVFHFALSITGNYHDSQDILQDTFIRIRTGSYKSGNAKAFLFTITRNLALSCLRAKKKTVGGDAILTLEDTGNIETSTELSQALMGLTSVERQIVLLHVLGGFRHKEIADLLSMPAGTVMWKYHRAIGKLKKSMDERGSIYEQEEIVRHAQNDGSVRHA
jgi:RNA polymerase sigma factor (sigma-70 family)